MFIVMDQVVPDIEAHMRSAYKTISPIIAAIFAILVFLNQREVNLFLVQLSIHMVPVPIDKLHETLGLIYIFKNQITIFGRATLNDRHVFTWHDEIRATRQCGKKTIKGFCVLYFPAVFPGKKHIKFLQVILC